MFTRDMNITLTAVLQKHGNDWKLDGHASVSGPRTMSSTRTNVRVYTSSMNADGVMTRMPRSTSIVMRVVTYASNEK